MNAAIEGIMTDRAALLRICADLTPADWAAPSGCHGWSVKDLVAHLGALFWALVDASRLPDTAGLPTEKAQDACVAARRDMSGPAVLADYAEVSMAALPRLVSLAGLNMMTPLGDLGTYPASLLPAAFSFDHFVHIRADLFRPRGPLAERPLQTDKCRLDPVLDWIEAALPQQNPAVAENCRLELQITGPAVRVIAVGTGQAMATVSSDAGAFVRWVTQRGCWEELGVRWVGDESAVAAARTLRVF